MHPVSPGAAAPRSIGDRHLHAVPRRSIAPALRDVAAVSPALLACPPRLGYRMYAWCEGPDGVRSVGAELQMAEDAHGTCLYQVHRDDGLMVPIVVEPHDTHADVVARLRAALFD